MKSSTKQPPPSGVWKKNMGGEQEVRAREEVEPKEVASRPGGWIFLPTEGQTTCEEVAIEIQPEKEEEMEEEPGV
jgi:hypothetical protein